MKKLLNTLYVTSENSYLGLDGENIVVFEEDKEKGRLPLHNLEGIVSFGYRGVSPALMGSCAEKNISLCFMTPQGKLIRKIRGSESDCLHHRMLCVGVFSGYVCSGSFEHAES